MIETEKRGFNGQRSGTHNNGTIEQWNIKLTINSNN